MATSRNMPARFKSRHHLKSYVDNCFNSRGAIIYRLKVVAGFRDSYLHRLRSVGLHPTNARSTYGLTSAKVSYGTAKDKLLLARRYRKSVVLPRLP